MPVKVNEFQCALRAAGGSRKPCEAGIRLIGEKFVFIKQDPEL
jgi:hypothetical protein